MNSKKEQITSLSKNQILIIILIFTLTFFLVFSPHIANPYPLHIDEWRHITEAIKLKENLGLNGFASIEIGFHIFLAILSIPFKIILIYKFLPAIWAIISALTLFFIIKNKTSNLKSSFLIATLSIIFFASLKSNVNIGGIWFFTPLTFSIPFIYLYIYLFTEGIQRQNKKYILISLAIMSFITITHSISLLFAIPLLIIFALSHSTYLKKEYKFFSIFLLIPIIGFLFYKSLSNLTFLETLKQLLINLQFKKGWGVLEIHNSPFELYSPLGYILAIIGFITIILNKITKKQLIIFPLWTITILIYIIFFKITGISPLSPYQRNLYYLAISLPFLSAYGLFYILTQIAIQINNSKIKNKKQTYKYFKIVIITLTILLIFASYYSVPKNLKLYKVIDKPDYETLIYLSTLQHYNNSKIMAPASIAPAIFPITKQEPVGTIFFYGNRKDADNFFKDSTNCTEKNKLLKKYNTQYILSKKLLNCSWEIIYNQTNNTIYKINII